MSLRDLLPRRKTAEIDGASLLVVVDKTGHVSLVVDADQTRDFLVVAETDLDAA